MAGWLLNSTPARCLVLFSLMLIALLGDVSAQGEEETVGGPLNLPPEEAGTVALIALIGLGVVGFVLIVTISAMCGYRVQANALQRKLRDVEMAANVKKNGGPTTVVYSEIDDLDLPPPPPKSPLPQDEDDSKPPVCETPTSEVLTTADVSSEAGLDNEGYSDEAIDQALNDMDAAVDESENEPPKPLAEPEVAEPPAEVEAQEQPAEAEAQEPPADGEAAEPPAEVGAPEPPAEAEAQEPPAEAEAQEPLAEVEAPEPPAEAEVGEPPADVEAPEPPAEVEAPEPPADAEVAEPTAESEDA